MSVNILVTGAAGYIGGSILTALLSNNSVVLPKNIFAAVRRDEQVQSLKPLGINVVQLDLLDEKAVTDAVLEHEIDIVIHTASSVDGRQAIHLIKGLGKRREATGKPTYHVHSSVTTGYSKEGGWPYGPVKDGDPIYKLEKELNDGFVIRTVNTAIIDEARAQGVTNMIISVPFVYGTGTGQWKKLSQNIPATIKASIALKAVYKFDQNSNFVAVHIEDLAEYYILFLEKILLLRDGDIGEKQQKHKEHLPSGEKGYYFSVAHEVGWWEIAQALAGALHARGLVADNVAKLWPSDDMAAEALDLPRQYVRLMHTASVDVDYAKRFPLGWQPTWDKQKLLASIDEEIDATLKYDKGRTTLFDSLKPSA